MPHQTSALEFINSNLDNNIGTLHGDPAGTGKTLPSLLACARVTPPGSYVLWVTLATIKQQLVEDGINKFNIPLAPTVLIGTPKQRMVILENLKPGILIINYEQILNEAELSIIAGLPISIICCDESVRLGNQGNKTYKQLLKLANYKKCKRLCMSGDPVANNPMEAYALFEYLNPGCLGNWRNFVLRYMNPNPWSLAGTTNLVRLPELAKRLEPYYIRRKREDLQPDLPDLLEQDLPITMLPAEEKLYKQIRADLLFEIEKSDINKISSPHTMSNGIVKFLRLRQLCVSPYLLGENHESSKLNTLKEYVSTLNGAKCLIFTEFATAVPFIEESLPVGSVLAVQGSTPQIERQGIVDRFQKDPDIRYLIGTSAMEMGLNLQAADFVIHLDPPLTYSSYDQRCSRARRQGRNDKVVSVRMVTANSLESRIYKLIEKKRNISLEAMPYSELRKELLT